MNAWVHSCIALGAMTFAITECTDRDVMGCAGRCSSSWSLFTELGLGRIQSRSLAGHPCGWRSWLLARPRHALPPKCWCARSWVCRCVTCHADRCSRASLTSTLRCSMRCAGSRAVVVPPSCAWSRMSAKTRPNRARCIASCKRQGFGPPSRYNRVPRSTSISHPHPINCSRRSRKGIAPMCAVPSAQVSTCMLAPTDADLDAFYGLMEATAARAEFAIHSREYYRVSLARGGR